MRDKNIKFVRIKGRIVPIRLNKMQKKALKTSAGSTALGVGVALASGKITAEHFKVEKRIIKVASKIMPFSFKYKGKNHPLKNNFVKIEKRIDRRREQLYEKLLDKSHRVGKRGFKFGQKGKLLSSILIGFGAEQAVKATGLEDISSEAVGVGAGIASSIAMNHQFNKSYKGLKSTKALSVTAKSIFKKAAKFVVKRKFKI